MRLFILVLFSTLILGCTSELHHGLEEREANEIVVALERKGIEAQKKPDPRDPLFWTVSVPEAVRVDAWNILSSEGLPRPRVQGFGEFYPREALVPSASEERILVQYATAQELRQTLVLVDGVVDAQVNLVIPEQPRIRLSGEEAPRPRASVLVKYREVVEGELPITEEEIARVVTGAVDRMLPEDVQVMFSKMENSVMPEEQVRVTQVGPIAVVNSGKFALQATIGGLFSVILVLVGAVLFLVMRKR